MRGRLVACISIFAVMALSNAIVPLLPSYHPSASIQGIIYAGYFLGAFALTLPAGILSDLYGRITVMRSGLFVTVPSGLILCIFSDPVVVILARLLEGAGAGLFVAATMAYINSLPDHEAMSGWYMASLNTGLVLGLVVSGYLAVTITGMAGIAVFTGTCLVGTGLSLTISEPYQAVRDPDPRKHIPPLIAGHWWFWYSAVILIGITGVVTSLYPAFSLAGNDIDSIWIAGMSVSTILTSLVVSRMFLRPVNAIRTGAVIMAAGVILILYSPAGFLIIGAAAGIVIIAQMNFLSHATRYQGIAMGLFSTASYLGMGVLPFLSGFMADSAGYRATFIIFTGAALSVALTIGKAFRPARIAS